MYMFQKFISRIENGISQALTSKPIKYVARKQAPMSYPMSRPRAIPAKPAAQKKTAYRVPNYKGANFVSKSK